MIKKGFKNVSLDGWLAPLKIYWPQVLIISTLVLIIVYLFPGGKSLKYTYQVNDITQEAIIAPTTFPIQKTEKQLKLDLDEKLNSVEFVFHRDEAIVNGQIKALDLFFISLNDIRQAQKQFEESKRLVYERKYQKQYEKAQSDFVADSTNLDILTQAFYTEYPFAKGKENWQKFLLFESSTINKKFINVFKIELRQICKNRWAEGIYDIPYGEILSTRITLEQGSVPILAKPSNYHDLQDAWTRAKKELIDRYQEYFYQNLGNDIIVDFMKPNLIYNREITKARQEAALNKVPRSQGVVLKNEMIVDANQRVTENILQKLNSLALITEESENRKGISTRFWNFVGKFILISVVISFFFTFLLVYRISIFNEWKMVLLISLIFALELILAHIIVIQFSWSEYFIPITVSAMALTILFDSRIGFMATTSIALLLGMMMGHNLDFIIVSLFTSSVAVYNIRDLRTRSQLFITLFALIAASMVAVLGLGLFKAYAWNSILFDIQVLVMISFLAPIVTYGLIGLFEIGFDITTNLTLIELLDFEHPLLKRAQRETNGTFNHSIVVGNLAESCTAAINANSLLCRVGAYYHDIGKMVKSDYFIENQFSGENLHDDLTSTMSAKIIRSHVTEGLKLAKEYGLPTTVSDFIPMHHGTTRVEYFYRKALEEVDGDISKVDDSQFRYPGPKPNTKETGILMICEAVEAAIKSLKNPDIMKIEAMIDKIIKARIDDGQLDECPLTMDELRRIKGTVDGQTGMLPVLRGIYHIRIEYPDDPLANKINEGS
jgi:hypothetical protein